MKVCDQNIAIIQKNIHDAPQTKEYSVWKYWAG